MANLTCAEKYIIFKHSFIIRIPGSFEEDLLWNTGNISDEFVYVYEIMSCEHHTHTHINKNVYDCKECAHTKTA